MAEILTQTCTQIAEPIMQKFRQIETCLECSAKQLVNVAEVFYHALKAVVNPVAPLFDAQAEEGQGSMTPLCIRALKRIFVINDVDKVCHTSTAWSVRDRLRSLQSSPGSACLCLGACPRRPACASLQYSQA